MTVKIARHVASWKDVEALYPKPQEPKKTKPKTANVTQAAKTATFTIPKKVEPQILYDEVDWLDPKLIKDEEVFAQLVAKNNGNMNQVNNQINTLMSKINQDLNNIAMQNGMNSSFSQQSLQQSYQQEIAKKQNELTAELKNVMQSIWSSNANKW